MRNENLSKCNTCLVWAMLNSMSKNNRFASIIKCIPVICPNLYSTPFRRLHLVWIHQLIRPLWTWLGHFYIMLKILNEITSSNMEYDKANCIKLHQILQTKIHSSNSMILHIGLPKVITFKLMWLTSLFIWLCD